MAILNINKEKSDKWRRTSRLQLPAVNTIIASNNNILQKEDIVKKSSGRFYCLAIVLMV